MKYLALCLMCVSCFAVDSGRAYTYNAFRQTYWIDLEDKWVDAEVEFNDSVNSVHVLGYSFNEDWGIDLGTKWSEDGDELLEDIMGAIHGPNVTIKYEIARIHGKYSTPGAKISYNEWGSELIDGTVSEKSSGEFDNEYKYIAIGITDALEPFTVGAAYIQWETPTVYEDTNYNQVPALLDPKTEFTGIGLWWMADSLRNRMEAIVGETYAMNAFWENDFSSIGWGFDAEGIMGFGKSEISDDALNYYRRTVDSGASEDASTGFFIINTARLQTEYVVRIGSGSIGVATGVEGRWHLGSITSTEFDLSDDVYLHPESGYHMLMWGPYVAIAAYW